MSADIQKLEGLVHLARETDPAGRQILLRNITDIFFDNADGLTDTESHYFGDIMGTVSQDLEIEIRKQLSQELSINDSAPRNLIKKFAADEIDVARPILMNSTVLTDSDLVEVIKKQGQEHIMAITNRKRISETVTDSIVEHGNDEVLVSVVSNSGAELSKKSLETVVERARVNPDMQQPLFTHRELPVDLVEKIINHVSSELRQQILESTPDIDREKLNQVLESANQKFETTAKEDAEKSERFIERKEKLHKLNPAFLNNLLQQQRIPEFLTGFSKLSKLDIRTARQTVFDDAGERLVIACKAIGYEKNEFEDLVDLSDFKGTRTIEDKEELIGIYSRITPEAAQRAMRFFKTRNALKK